MDDSVWAAEKKALDDLDTLDYQDREDRWLNDFVQPITSVADKRQFRSFLKTIIDDMCNAQPYQQDWEEVASHHHITALRTRVLTELYGGGARKGSLDLQELKSWWEQIKNNQTCYSCGTQAHFHELGTHHLYCSARCQHDAYQ